MAPKNIDAKYIINLLKGWVTNNKTLKLLALLIALVLWAYVNMDLNSKVIIDVPLQINTPIDSNLVIVGDINKNVSVSLWGPNDLIRTIGPSQIKASLQIDKANKGEMRFELTARNVFVPNKVKVLEISPKIIKLNFTAYTGK